MARGNDGQKIFLGQGDSKRFWMRLALSANAIRFISTLMF